MGSPLISLAIYGFACFHSNDIQENVVGTIRTTVFVVCFETYFGPFLWLYQVPTIFCDIIGIDIILFGLKMTVAVLVGQGDRMGFASFFSLWCFWQGTRFKFVLSEGEIRTLKSFEVIYFMNFETPFVLQIQAKRLAMGSRVELLMAHGCGLGLDWYYYT